MRNQIGSEGPTVILTLEISYEFSNQRKRGNKRDSKGVNKGDRTSRGKGNLAKTI